jgi:selenide,water dikinase
MRLTSLSHGAGCACKIGANQLAEIRSVLPKTSDPRLLIGLDEPDDAAVYRVGDDLALVQTIDFFTPIVDDPFDFGRIAAANALSDIYAMGAKPVLALNVLGFPLGLLGEEVLAAILRGGAETAARAGIVVAGGHSIDDPEPKYGMAVTGLVDPDHLLGKFGGRSGDLLFLTKPIGGGLATTAAKKDLVDHECMTAAIEVMTALNASGAASARAADAHAMTDVTGFGLLGHLHELCLASGLAADVNALSVPAIPGTLELARNPNCQAGGSRRNAEHADGFTVWEAGVRDEHRVLLTDAMTSGGLLLAAPPQESAHAPGVCIGELRPGTPGEIQVRAMSNS